MTIDHKTRDEKVHYDFNREVEKISVLSIDKIENKINMLKTKKYYLLLKVEY